MGVCVWASRLCHSCKSRRGAHILIRGFARSHTQTVQICTGGTHRRRRPRTEHQLSVPCGGRRQGGQAEPGAAANGVQGLVLQRCQVAAMAARYSRAVRRHGASLAPLGLLRLAPFASGRQAIEGGRPWGEAQRKLQSVGSRRGGHALVGEQHRGNKSRARGLCGQVMIWQGLGGRQATGRLRSLAGRAERAAG